MTEKEKMQNGLVYNILDKELQELEGVARKLLYSYNHSRPDETIKKQNVLQQLLRKYNPGIYIVPPFMCMFGFNIHFNGKAIINTNCVMLDSAPIHLGENLYVGPGTCFAAASHPIIAEERNAGLGTSKPITIGKNVWIGANCTILGGITIGDKSIIGAGCVVTKDIPSGVIAVGNPCKVLREITAKDRLLFTTNTV